MGIQIYVPGKKIWEFFKDNLDRLRHEKVVVAENTDTGYAILLTEIDGESANLIVERNETHIASSYERGEEGCAKSYACLFYKYLLPLYVEEPDAVETQRSFSDYDIPDDLPPDVVFENEEEDIPPEEEAEEPVDEDIDDVIYQREDALRFAMADCLSVMMDEGEGDGAEILNMYGEDFVDEVTDHMLSYLAGDQGIAVYRPTIITDDNGNDELVEYPYN